jgi:hypothetical protein
MNIPNKLCTTDLVTSIVKWSGNKLLSREFREKNKLSFRVCGNRDIGIHKQKWSNQEHLKDHRNYA